MIPVQFDYIAPERLADAVQLLKVRAGASALAGGHNLLLDLKRRRVAPTLLVDLRKIPELRDIRRAEDGGLDIGAMMTYSELLASEEVRKDYPALVEALASLGDAQVRNRATIGGSLAYNDPTADLPAVALVLEAVIKTVGPSGERARPAEEFLIGALKTTLESGEIVAAIHFPASVAGAWSAYEKFKCPATGAAICGVAAMVARGNGEGVCRVAVTGAAGHSARLHKVEAALTGLKLTAENIAAAAEQAGHEAIDFVSDFHASAEYRTHLTQVLAERALTRAAERAGYAL
jgi:aerobic carbon-monoxide dehydrogenase medium subunit